MLQLIWVPHEREGFVSASIIEEKPDGTYKVQIVETGQNMEYSQDECQKANPPKFDKVSSLNLNRVVRKF